MPFDPGIFVKVILKIQKSNPMKNLWKQLKVKFINAQRPTFVLMGTQMILLTQNI